MKKRTISLILAAAAVSVFGFASTAQATPTQTTSCSTCHGGPTTAVSVGITAVSNNGTTASYKVTVSGGSTKRGWAVLEGSINRAHASSSSGTFSVPVGSTYRIWGVSYGTGANYKSISPVKPMPAPSPGTTPTVPPTGTVTASSITIDTDAITAVRFRPFVLTGLLTPHSDKGNLVVVQVRRPGSARWSYSSTRLTNASGVWWYRYRPIVNGTYSFRAIFRGIAASQSSVVSSVLSVPVGRAISRELDD